MKQVSSQVAAALKKLATPERAKASAWFFKTNKGQYGYGDTFIGVSVPDQRSVAKMFKGLSLSEIQKLLKSQVHEHRLTGLIILVEQFKKATEAERKKIHEFYLKNLDRVNNWDLVDTSAPDIVGRFLLDKPKAVLNRLVKAKNLWHRRVAIVGTYGFIKNGKLDETFRLAEQLFDDTEDLMHKATGWMLREAGKKDQKKLEQFLQKYATKMPRTMLRYAIEKFPEHVRKKYLKM